LPQYVSVRGSGFEATTITSAVSVTSTDHTLSDLKLESDLTLADAAEVIVEQAFLSGGTLTTGATGSGVFRLCTFGDFAMTNTADTTLENCTNVAGTALACTGLGLLTMKNGIMYGDVQVNPLPIGQFICTGTTFAASTTTMVINAELISPAPIVAGAIFTSCVFERVVSIMDNPNAPLPPLPLPSGGFFYIAIFRSCQFNTTVNMVSVANATGANVIFQNCGFGDNVTAGTVAAAAGMQFANCAIREMFIANAQCNFNNCSWGADLHIGTIASSPCSFQSCFLENLVNVGVAAQSNSSFSNCTFGERITVANTSTVTLLGNSFTSNAGVNLITGPGTTSYISDMNNGYLLSETLSTGGIVAAPGGTTG
jgi:hypothetical protein